MVNISIRPKIEKANSLLKRGNISEAEILFRTVLRKYPANPDALAGLEKIGVQQGTRKFTNPTKTQFDELAKLYGEKKFDQIVAKIAVLLKIFPNSHELFYMQGSAFRQLSRFDVAIECYRNAISLRPDYADAYVNLGLSFKDANNITNAIKCFLQAVKLNPSSFEANYNAGKALYKLGDIKSSIKYQKAAIFLRPLHAESHKLLGNTLASKGEFDEAITCFRKAIELKPDYAECYRAYFSIGKFEKDDPLIPRLREFCSDNELPDHTRVHFYFALSHVEENQGNREEMIRYLMLGSALRKKELSYDHLVSSKDFEQIKSFFVKVANLGATYENQLPTRPIFVLGMPRSGTTLTEQIISSHSKVFGAGELEFLREAVQYCNWETSNGEVSVFENLRNYYANQILGLRGNPYIVDKMPANFRWVGFIINALPEAKIVYLQRNPAAVCWSNFKQYFPATGMDFTFDMQDVAKYYLLHHDLMNYWSKIYPDKIYTLNYEKLTENQEEETRKLFAYLGLDWEDKVLDFHKSERSVRTASNQQVRKKMYKGSSEEWKKYEPWLGEMLEILKPVM
jgi:tetratricopeptide (TPR) repeat protein